MNLHEIIGKQQVEIEQLKAEKTQLIQFLRELKAGDRSVDDIQFAGDMNVKKPEPALNGAAPDGD